MATQEKVAKKNEGTKEEQPVTVNQKAVDKGKEIKKDLDKLVDKIDDALLENAEQFVKNYVQKGGQ